MIDSSTLASKKRTFYFRENDAKESTTCKVITPYNPDLGIDIISQIFHFNFSLNEFKQLASLSKLWSGFAREALIEKSGSFKINAELFYKQLKIEIKEFISGKIPFSRPLGLAEAHEKDRLFLNPKTFSLSKIHLKVISKTYNHLGHEKSLSLFASCKPSQRETVLHCLFRHSRLNTEVTISKVSEWVKLMKIPTLNLQSSRELKCISEIFLQEAFLFSIDAYFQETEEANITNHNNWRKIISNISEFNLNDCLIINSNFFTCNIASNSIRDEKIEQISYSCVHRLTKNLYAHLEITDRTLGASKVLSFLKLIPNQILKKQIGKSLCFRFYSDNFFSENIVDQWQLAMGVSRITGLLQKYTKIIFLFWLVNDQKKLLEVLKSDDSESAHFQLDLIKLLENFPEFLGSIKVDTANNLHPSNVKFTIYQAIFDLMLSRGMQEMAFNVLNHFPCSPLRNNLKSYVDDFLIQKLESRGVDGNVEDTEGLDSLDLDLGMDEDFEEDANKTLSYYSDLDYSA